MKRTRLLNALDGDGTAYAIHVFTLYTGSGSASGRGEDVEVGQMMFTTEGDVVNAAGPDEFRVARTGVVLRLAQDAPVARPAPTAGLARGC